MLSVFWLRLSFIGMVIGVKIPDMLFLTKKLLCFYQWNLFHSETGIGLKSGMCEQQILILIGDLCLSLYRPLSQPEEPQPHG